MRLDNIPMIVETSNGIYHIERVINEYGQVVGYVYKEGARIRVGNRINKKAKEKSERMLENGMRLYCVQ